MNETRTRDPDLGKVVLYQLSYHRIKNVFNFYKTTAFFPKAGAKVRQIFELTKYFCKKMYFLCIFIKKQAKSRVMRALHSGARGRKEP